MCSDNYNQVWSNTFCDAPDNIEENYKCHRPVGHDASKCWNATDCCQELEYQHCVGPFKASDTGVACGNRKSYFECHYNMNNTNMALNYKICNGLDDSQEAIDADDTDKNGLLISKGNKPTLK